MACACACAEDVSLAIAVGIAISRISSFQKVQPCKNVEDIVGVYLGTYYGIYRIMLVVYGP